jgi:hypothetical protein
VPTPKKRIRPLPILCLVGIAAGVLVVVAGALWPMLGVGHSVYTPEQAKKWELANTAVHAATLGRGPDGSVLPGADTPEGRQAAVAAAKKKYGYEEARAELESARFAQDQLGKWLIGAGLAATVVFGIGYVASRNEGE